MVLRPRMHACCPLLCIIGCTSAIQASLIAFGLHDNSGRALPTLKSNKFAQNILPTLNAPRLQNRHFDQFSSFGMVSVFLRNDIGIIITRKNEIYTNAFFMNFHAPASPHLTMPLIDEKTTKSCRKIFETSPSNQKMPNDNVSLSISIFSTTSLFSQGKRVLILVHVSPRFTTPCFFFRELDSICILFMNWEVFTTRSRSRQNFVFDVQANCVSLGCRIYFFHCVRNSFFS